MKYLSLFVYFLMFGLKCWLEGLNGDVLAFMRYECDW